MASSPVLPSSSAQLLHAKRTRTALSETNVLVLDLRGTLTDWCTPVSNAVARASGQDVNPREFAVAWYAEIYATMSRVWAQNDAKTLPQYCRLALDSLVARRRIHGWTLEVRDMLCDAWIVGSGAYTKCVSLAR